ILLFLIQYSTNTITTGSTYHTTNYGTFTFLVRYCCTCYGTYHTTNYRTFGFITPAFPVCRGGCSCCSRLVIRSVYHCFPGGSCLCCCRFLLCSYCFH